MTNLFVEAEHGESDRPEVVEVGGVLVLAVLIPLVRTVAASSLEGAVPSTAVLLHRLLPEAFVLTQHTGASTCV